MMTCRMLYIPKVGMLGVVQVMQCSNGGGAAREVECHAAALAPLAARCARTLRRAKVTQCDGGCKRRVLHVHAFVLHFLLCLYRSQSCTGRRRRTCTRRLFRSTCKLRKHSKQRRTHTSWPMMLPVTMTGSELAPTGIIFVSNPIY